MGDLDGDGLDEIAYLESSNTSSRSVVRSGLTGTLLCQFPAGYYLLGLGDINGNGHDDIAVGSRESTVNGMYAAGSYEILDGGTLQVLRVHAGTVINQLLGVERRLGDLDGDGVDDYYLSDHMRRTGISGATGATLFVIPGGWLSNYAVGMMDLGDVNGDGFDDVGFVSRWPGYPDDLLVYAGPNLSQLLWSHYPGFPVPGPEDYTRFSGRLGDIDGDGYADIGLEGSTPSAPFTVISGRTQGVIYASGLFAGRFRSPGDVDGDGFPEFPSAGGGGYQIISHPPPGVTRYGAGCAGPSGYQPRIGIGIGARLGRTLTVNLANASPNLVAAVLGVGFSSQQWQGRPLPLDLTAYGLPGCQWHVETLASFTVPTTAGANTPRRATHAVPVPQAPALLGSQLFWQWLVFESTPAGLGGAVTRAFRTVVVQ